MQQTIMTYDGVRERMYLGRPIWTLPQDRVPGPWIAGLWQDKHTGRSILCERRGDGHENFFEVSAQLAQKIATKKSARAYFRWLRQNCRGI